MDRAEYIARAARLADVQAALDQHRTRLLAEAPIALDGVVTVD